MSIYENNYAIPFISQERGANEKSIAEDLDAELVIYDLWNGKAPGPDGLQAKLFKSGGQRLKSFIINLITKIWKSEVITEDWRRRLICLI